MFAADVYFQDRGSIFLWQYIKEIYCCWVYIYFFFNKMLMLAVFMWFFLSGLFCYSTVFKCWRPKIGKIFTSCLYVRTLRSSSTTVRVFAPLPTVLKKIKLALSVGFFFIFPLNQTTLIRVACPCDSKGFFRCQTKTFSCTSIHSHCSRYEDVDGVFFLSKVRHLLKDRSSVLMLEKTLCCCVFLQV